MVYLSTLGDTISSVSLTIVLHAEYNIIGDAYAAEKAIDCRHKEQLGSSNEDLCDHSPNRCSLSIKYIKLHFWVL